MVGFSHEGIVSYLVICNGGRFLWKNLERRDYLQYFDEVDAERLKTPEDIFEVYDSRMRTQYGGHTAAIGGKDRITPNIFSADGLEDLALTAPQD